MLNPLDLALSPDPRPSSRLSPTAVEPSAMVDPLKFMSQELPQLVGPIPTDITQKKNQIVIEIEV